MVENSHPESLELRVINDPADVDGFAGVANPRADGKGDII